MTRTEDANLSVALEFIIGRITEEAVRSGQPLDQDEQFLLANLPRNSTFSLSTDGEVPLVAPRDFVFEKLCTLAKAARAYDLSPRPEAENDWMFATAVLKLHGHPMLWLLQWAGIKEKKPWWDRWLLFFAAIVLVGSGFIGMAIFENATFRGRAWWAVVLAGFVAALLLLALLSQRLERWRLRRVIERCRPSFAS